MWFYFFSGVDDATDHLGSVEAVTDTDGKLVWSNDYLPFGNTALFDTSRFILFTGKQLDGDTGLYYFNNRWYDPDLGRFTSEDPIRDGQNWYVYCSCNPLRYVDLLGLEDDDLYDYAYSHEGLDLYKDYYNNPSNFMDYTGWETDFPIYPTFEHAVNLDFGYDYALMAEYNFTNGYIFTGIFLEVDAACEMAYDMVFAYFGAQIFGSVVSASSSFFEKAARGVKDYVANRKASGEGTSIPDFVGHGAERALERGFTPERIAQVLKEGNAIEAVGRYGTQTRYTLGSNTVVVAAEGRNVGQIITTFSTETINGIKGYWVEP